MFLANVGPVSRQLFASFSSVWGKFCASVVSAPCRFQAGFATAVGRCFASVGPVSRESLGICVIVIGRVGARFRPVSRFFRAGFTPDFPANRAPDYGRHASWLQRFIDIRFGCVRVRQICSPKASPYDFDHFHMKLHLLRVTRVCRQELHPTAKSGGVRGQHYGAIVCLFDWCRCFLLCLFFFCCPLP